MVLTLRDGTRLTVVKGATASELRRLVLAGEIGRIGLLTLERGWCWVTLRDIVEIVAEAPSANLRVARASPGPTITG
jgi:hypothetical protein